jgi:hypothetical protein
MKKILTELGYCSLHTLSQVDTPKVLQETVVELFGNSTEYQNLPENEKKALLGPMYWGNPSKFKFLPGERAALISIKSLCMSLMDKIPLVYASPSIPENNTAVEQFTIKAGKTRKNQANQEVDRRNILDACGRTISNYINNWCERKHGEFIYGTENYEIQSSGRIFCLTCKLHSRYILSTTGYWKTTFTDHKLKRHSLQTLGILTL